ncbi:UDP-N-acetylmuramoyl-L-alanyl-D-glutamate--2,6-diaminopimelate ligase [Leptospira sp. 2 VSF19]|uniref:UDP-N-acetylmuramoyl-L-alanyl-D-glutamate--2,6-diaminopimelate ligase n=1 Tax=Leptospira soteropolitanensis TaxID=2950025 RepID=A0AAW5VME4_9LEPT|nr:UDP-N-acetylmuramoyl-L-alanyl-D-glutamate--2,6-diaminopimelate ligase [Leptospira soteropolitanensis]MCW7492127.1 UDP-N-acetylmuramoyl-L-alanyl-D-glutamate--2,6-diaminopimelate ligase [Leptospira soteropolitanensis]MCW7499709.1 UDP-N-acetylmuramoyl-L-alanyl-D-glutamate--2,6-diaminopimelate ligase [Leptospira soteropolitanensis]MCW7521960.1 UDP-N-acetylmuramoyl-L-alanyl-D-glutamate--2,6-diaminopimelate ligase [Leptospira soteropolitanensis]MCW7525814.1 UDP-N-acetylmuramoyl-L-alanyl-D-glutamat
MKLSEILKRIPDLKQIKGENSLEVDYIWGDSRKLKPNDIFVLPEDTNENQELFLKMAVDLGSKVVLVSKRNLKLKGLELFSAILESEDSVGEAHGKIACFLAGNPAKKMKLVAITGTNGKTSLTFILFHLARKVGKNAALIGTVQIQIMDRVLESGYTTPDASSLNLLLKQMLEEGIEYVFMEMSSHGLKLGRVAGLEITCAGFTNLTQDHLDFHPSMEDYFESKFKIFQLLEQSSVKNKFGLVAGDVSYGNTMIKRIAEAKLKSPIYILGKSGEFNYTNTKLSLLGSEYRFHKKAKNLPFVEVRSIKTNLLGNFNVFNTSFALAIAYELGFPWEEVISCLENIPTVPGRFQVVPFPDKSRIAVVDYAHTPDALENILKSCVEIVPKQIICLFGCGGDRDRTKRPQMARIAENLADLVILTSDNPRTESSEAILDEIESGFSRGFQRYEKITDRRVAIQRAVGLLERDGILVVAGKGHETYQIIGKEKTKFVDFEEIENAFQNLGL